LIYTVYGIDKQSDNIGHEAHLGGALAGLLLAIVYRFDLAQENWWLAIILLVVPILLLLIVMKRKKR
jgi:membrane associated rhomboid family serine protease